MKTPLVSGNAAILPKVSPDFWKDSFAVMQASVNAYCPFTNYRYPMRDFQAIQSASRIFHRYPELYREQTAKISAKIIASQIVSGQKVYAADEPMLIYRRFGNKVVSIWDNAAGECYYEVPVFPGKKILIPGAGYNALSEFPQYQAVTHHTILNDKNKFVSKVLDKVARLIQANQITVMADGMETLQLEDRSVAVTLSSRIHSAGPEAIDKFIENAKRFLTKGGLFFTMNPTDPNSLTAFDANDLRNSLLSHGFTICEEKVYSHKPRARMPSMPYFELENQDLFFNQLEKDNPDYNNPEAKESVTLFIAQNV